MTLFAENGGKHIVVLNIELHSCYDLCAEARELLGHDAMDIMTSYTVLKTKYLSGEEGVLC